MEVMGRMRTRARFWGTTALPVERSFPVVGRIRQRDRMQDMLNARVIARYVTKMFSDGLEQVMRQIWKGNH
jgi:hypothetical protein